MSRNEVDAQKFQESITKELDTVKDRVRNLIGSSNWGEEGRYKEAILRNVIRRFLPSNLSLGTGFVINKDNNRTQITHQIDIIIYDNTIPILFLEGEFVITTYRNVKAIIEVKTRIRNSDLKCIIKKAEEDGEIIGKRIFNGIFSYGHEGDIDSDRVDDALKSAEGYVNHLSLGKDIFIRFWNSEDRNRLDLPVWDCEGDFYNIYGLENLSFSYFISNLLDMACSEKLDDIWWFLFPIEGTKEVHKERTVCLHRT